MTERNQWLGLIVFIAICIGAGGLGAIATTPEIDTWYKSINKPTWTPPGFVFGPVWTTLYIMMGVAAWLVWKRGGFRQSRTPLALFAVQLLLNVSWSWIFFNQHQLGWAFAEIIMLWTAIVATTIAFFKSSRAAGVLMLPYLAWVSFAAALNHTIWQLN